MGITAADAVSFLFFPGIEVVARSKMVAFPLLKLILSFYGKLSEVLGVISPG